MTFFNHTDLSLREQLPKVAQKISTLGDQILSSQPEISYQDYAEKLNQQLHLNQYSQFQQKDFAYFIEQLNDEKLTTLWPDSVIEPQLYADNLTPHIAIIGAGLAGLLTGFVLTSYGAKVDIFEKRSYLDSRVRPQNISFKEAEKRLRPLLGETVYKEFFRYGGALDGDTGKLRITTGSFQDILTQALQNTETTIHYEHPIGQQDFSNFKQFDAIIISTGVHACKALGLEDKFQPVVFDNFNVFGRTALFAKACDKEHGYFREEREGYHWRRDNISIFSGEAFAPDIKRIIHRFEKKQINPEQLPRLKALLNEKTIQYTFCFGNDTEQFMQNLPANHEACLIEETRFKVEPMIALNPVSELHGIPLIAMGDTNGSPHPLAAIGTLKFIRNVSYLTTTVFAANYLKKQGYENQVIRQLYEIYKRFALDNNIEVFFANLFCSVFSRQR